MPVDPEHRALAGYLSLTLVFADALAQANSEQRLRIEKEVYPLITGDLVEPGITKAREIQLVKRITDGLISILGDGWELDAETRKWVDGLLS